MVIAFSIIMSFLLWFWLSWIYWRSFLWMMLEQNFLWLGWLCFSLVALCFLKRDDLLKCWCFTRYFLYKGPNYFWIGIGVYFWSEDSLRQFVGFFNGMLSFLFRFSDEGFVLNFLRVALTFSYAFFALLNETWFVGF